VALASAESALAAAPQKMSFHNHQLPVASCQLFVSRKRRVKYSVVITTDNWQLATGNRHDPLRGFPDGQVMKIKRTEDGFLVVLDVGDEIIASLKEIVAAERIGMASLAYLDIDQKKYLKRELGPQSMELVSLVGNVARLDGLPALHCHAVVGDRELRVYGGHLFEATASVTVEIYLRIYEGEVARQYDPNSGANPIVL
jgi:predicted DNA-binding protein with PD1-like motif